MSAERDDGSFDFLALDETYPTGVVVKEGGSVYSHPKDGARGDRDGVAAFVAAMDEMPDVTPEALAAALARVDPSAGDADTFPPGSAALPTEVFSGLTSRPFTMPAPSRRWVADAKAALFGAGLGAAVLAGVQWQDSQVVKAVASAPVREVATSTVNAPAVKAARPEAVPVQQSGPVYNDAVKAFEGHAQQDLMVAATTNALVNGLEAPSAGAWLETPQALGLLERKLETWGGYDAVLQAGRSCEPESISAFLNCVRGSSLPHASVVASHLAKQVSAIQDARIVPNQEAVAARHETMRGRLEGVKTQMEAHPPVAPRAVKAAGAGATGTGSLGSLDSAYEVPEAGHVRPVMQPVIAPRMASSHDVPEAKAWDATEVVEPLHVKAPFSADELAFFKQGESTAATKAPVEQPVVKSTAPASWKERVESGVSTVKNALGGLGSRLGKWFGR